jgi:hypothetical protein
MGVSDPHDTLHTLHLDEISSVHIDRDKYLYAYSIQTINNYELKPRTARFNIITL